MSTETRKDVTFPVGDVRAVAAVFRSPFHPDHYYVVRKPRMNYLDFIARYNVGNVQCKQCDGYNLDDSLCPHFYAVFVADCFDPPIVLIRAASPSDAQDIFLDETPYAHITDPNDLKDYDPETLYYNSNGAPCDTESVQIHDVQLVRVECTD